MIRITYKHIDGRIRVGKIEGFLSDIEIGTIGYMGSVPRTYALFSGDLVCVGSMVSYTISQGYDCTKPQFAAIIYTILESFNKYDELRGINRVWKAEIKRIERDVREVVFTHNESFIFGGNTSGPGQGAYMQ